MVVLDIMSGFFSTIMASPIIQAMKQICEEKNISYESVLETVESALAAAFRKDYGEKDQNIKMSFDPEMGTMRAFDVKVVVEDMELPPETLESPESKKDERKTKFDFPSRSVTPSIVAEGVGEEPKWNPKTMIMLSVAKKLKRDASVGEEIRTELTIPGAFGRMAAQTAKQVIMQKLREAEREVVYNTYKDKEGQLIVATVQRTEGRIVIFDIGRATGVLPPEEQVPTERYLPGQRMKVYVTRVGLTTRGPEIVLSRTSPELVKKLFQFEIPEVANGVVEIRAIAREPGARGKVAVASVDPAIDPIGSCIGQRGTRIQTVISELGGEKIDVVSWDANPENFIGNALSPAKVVSVSLHVNEQTAVVRVLPDQLSLAIGRGGQNVRLAAKLTGWKITVAEEKGSGEAKGESVTVAEDGTIISATDPALTASQNSESVTEATSPMALEPKEN